MFTGIIKDIGTVTAAAKSPSSMRLSIAFQSADFENVQVDESICVSGVCLTVVAASLSNKIFEVDVVSETLKKTTLSQLIVGSRLNLERALRLQDRLGGHWTLGHTDCVSKLTSVNMSGAGAEMWIAYEPKYRPYLIPVGSITIDGVSLTIAEIGEHAFKVAIIPYTWGHTTLGERKTGDLVNVEFDVLGKYVENAIRCAPRS